MIENGLIKIDTSLEVFCYHCCVFHHPSLSSPVARLLYPIPSRCLICLCSNVYKKIKKKVSLVCALTNAPLFGLKTPTLGCGRSHRLKQLFPI
jgi:hypothetical protein